MRPRRVVVVAGTGTEIGKTFMGTAVARELRRQGRTVSARKPAQSFEPNDPTTDARELGAATGEDPEVVCPPHRWYPVPMAPPMAATALDRTPFTTADLAQEVRASWDNDSETPDIGLVETAGGSWSPQASDGLHVGDFANAMQADAVLLVADAGLGVINAVRGAIAAFAPTHPVIVLLNRYIATDELHVANRDWLLAEDRFNVVVDAAEAATALIAL